MIKQSDVFILLAVAISFALSGYLWFSGQREEGLFTALWVPSILCFGIYFKPGHEYRYDLLLCNRRLFADGHRDRPDWRGVPADDEAVRQQQEPRWR